MEIMGRLKWLTSHLQAWLMPLEYTTQQKDQDNKNSNVTWQPGG